MANKLVYGVGFSIPKVMLKRILFLFFFGVIYLTLVEAGKAEVEHWGFKHLPAQIFYFKESNVNIFLDYSGNVWISNDNKDGWNWIKAPDVPDNRAAALYMHPFSNVKAYILTTGKKHYKTSDRGETWQEFATERAPVRGDKVLSFHAKREDYLLYKGTECDWFECTDATYYTKDGFSTSEKLLENTNNCLWASSSERFDEAPVDSIFCIQYDVSKSGKMRSFNDFRLVESEDFFKKDVKIIDFNSGGDVRGVIGLAVTQEYMVAAVRDINSLNMTMYVSVDGQTWARAFFPLETNQKEVAYTLIESFSPNHLVIDVFTGTFDIGEIFTSNSNGTYFVSRLNHTNRNSEGFVDFEHSQSVDGVLLANIVSNYEEIEDGKFRAKKLRSKISFDDGITWKFIKPPKNVDFPCKDDGDWKQGTCSLHLHSITSQRNHGRIFSANEAPGVLMGVGNVGKYLFTYEQCDTFLSYDGGLTWKVVALGAHMYEIGHYGSILVMVDDEQPTDRISYSHDRGENWKDLSLGVKIRANRLITNPESTSKSFLLFGLEAGHSSGKSFKYFLFKLDFSRLFDRDCTDNDFDSWIARRPESNCFNGRKTYYYRRKADARCFVSKPRRPDEEICPCIRRDYECDKNYIFDKAQEICIPLVPKNPDKCKDGSTKKYKANSGFRVIPENKCDVSLPGSVNLGEPIYKSCSDVHTPPLYGKISHRTTNYEIGSYFYFPESPILMIKTTDGKVKRSVDEGTTWKDVLTEAGSIAYMFLHDHDQNKAYFFPDKADDDDNYYMWYTTDRGETFGKSELENEPNKLDLLILDFHPKHYKWLLFMASTPCPGCHSITYFSKNNGKSWKKIETWAQKCIFGKDTEFTGPENDAIFCLSYKNKNSGQSQDELGGRTSKENPLQLVKLRTGSLSKKELLENVVQFYIFNEFMAVATEEQGELSLYMSKDGERFSKAAFPPDISVNKQAYTILQSTTGSVFLDVYKSFNYGYEYGSLFKSNSDGTAYNKILNNTNRNFFGNVDFEKVQGLDGIIIANQVENIDEFGAKKKIISKISHDDGFRWKRLKDVKTLDDSSDCEDCYLNLHGRTEINGPGAIFSAPSAIGLLIGVGNFGKHLLPYAECDTFMSRDAGRSWSEIRKGPSLYEFGDQGTIIIVVDDKAPTNRIMYSWNYGKDWADYIFTNSTPVKVSLLTTNSNSTSMKFLLLGDTIPTSSTPVTITIDFTQLEKRKCDADDFEEWNPMDEDSNDHKCLLGERLKYQRRKADAECHIKEYEVKPIREICNCTKHDFECYFNNDSGFGYWRNETGGCELKGPDPDRPDYCQGSYYGRSGYVKMKKSKCEKDEDKFDYKIKKDCESGGEITSKIKIFNYQIMNYFYFDKTKTIMVLTTDNNVWQSINEGNTWNLTDIGQKIYGMVQHPYFNEYAYFITLGTTHFYTSDSGKNFRKLKVPIEPNFLGIPVLDFHPDEPKYLIYTGDKNCDRDWSPDCHSQAFYTKDYTKDGEVWKDLETYVKICTWARDKNFKVDPNLIFCESFRDKEGSQKKFENNPLQLVSSVDFFKSKHTHFESIIGLATFEEFMVVAALTPNGQSLRLFVSIDAKNFAEAQFPPNMPITHNAYTILESITNSVMLHVTTSPTNEYGKYGNILKSNGNGTYYSLSLENANRDDRGYVDFEKMRGIQGIALANIVSNVKEVYMGHDKKLKSMITFNDGATWNFLNAPKEDLNGQKYCDGRNDNCYLHLHSYTERRNPNDAFSSASAIGLMVGVGNVGDHLTPYLEGNTFLTNDAGYTWKEVKKGAYMYEFGDQGAIILLVDDEQPTNHVLYSLDEGSSWSKYNFTDDPIRIFDIDTLPGGLSSKFILRGISRDKEVIVHLDFTKVFTKHCDLSKDFDTWSPGQQKDDGDEKCLFGHTIKYLRRKPETECSIDNDLKLERKKGENCTCTEHDFECDYNYMRNDTGKCVQVPGAETLLHDYAAEQCVNGEEFWYEIETGYRKLKVSTCKLTGKSQPCPKRNLALIWIFIVLFSLFVAAVILFCCFLKRNDRSGRIRLGGSPIETSILPEMFNHIADIFYQISGFVSRLWSKAPLPGRRYSRSRYDYSRLATDDGHELMDNYDQDNEALG